MNGKLLCESLGIDRGQLNAWRAEGMPFTGSARRPTFDPAKVAAWLVEHGYAESAKSPQPPLSQPTILRTRDAAADHFGVSVRTIAQWIKAGMPGKPGSPGRQDGYFPIEEIGAWLARRRMPLAAAADDPRIHEEVRLKRFRANLAELEYTERAGLLVEATAMMREWVRAVNEAKTQMDQLPAWLAKKLGDAVDPQLRRELRCGLKRRLAESYRTLQLALDGQADELEAQGGTIEHGRDDSAAVEISTPDRADAAPGG